MTILEKENYRINTITRIDRGDVNTAYVDLPISEGLAIEKKCFDDSYYVICFVEYNFKEAEAEIESIGNRLFDIEDNEFKLFKDLVKTAISLVATANKNY